MAVRRLLQPNSTLRLCRLGFSAAGGRLCSSACSVGDTDSPPQLKDAADVEDREIMALGHVLEEAVEAELGLPRATSLGNVAGCDSLRESRALSDTFKVHKVDSTKTTALSDIFKVRKVDSTESEETEDDETLLDFIGSCQCDDGPSPSQSNGFQKAPDCKYSSMETANDGAGMDTDEPRSLVSSYQSSKNHEEDAEKKYGLQNIAPNPTKHRSSMGLIKDNSLHANVKRSDQHDRLNLPTLPAGTSTIEDMKEGREWVKVSLPTSKINQSQIQRKNPARTESQGNRVLIRFLKSFVSENQLCEYFSCCGEILKIECPYAQGPWLKTSYIDFKTREGLEKAIDKSGMQFCGHNITVESASSENRNTTPIPSLLGDPDISPALVKNPTRTIRIEQLTQEMSLCHIVEALAFCKSNVSGYFMGSSPSIAYVELETEIGKELALVQQSINVLGKDLVILRIDCPRTTAVRISSTSVLEPKNVMTICKSLGNIHSCTQRSSNVMDVNFKFAEWPNMLKILNRLNGCTVEDRLLKAAPAPIFPPEVLLALWPHPEERKHLKATAQALLHKIGSTLDSSELAFLENDLFSLR